MKMTHAMIHDALKGSGKNGSGDKAARAIMRMRRQQKSNSGLAPLQLSHLYKIKEAEIRQFFVQLKQTSETSEESLDRKVREGWQLLKQVGDPIAQLALNLTNRGSITSSRVADYALTAHLKAHYLQNNMPAEGDYTYVRLRRTGGTIRRPTDAWFAEQDAWANLQFRIIQKELLLSHIQAAWYDEKGQEDGRLDNEQIDGYHRSVFSLMI